MFKALKRQYGRATALLDISKSWDDAGGRYVLHFRSNLEALALDLTSATGTWVKARYNRELRCAEIFCPGDRTLALVQVHGEMCMPLTAHVTSPFLPAPALQELFRQHLRAPHIGDGPRAGMRIRFHAYA